MEKKIAKDLLSIGAVFLRPEQPFTWASGIKSPIYCDNRLTLTAPVVRGHVEAGLAEIVRTKFPEAEVLHWVDLLDARMNEMATVMTKVKPGAFSDKIWSLDRRLYRADYDALNPGEDKG